MSLSALVSFLFFGALISAIAAVTTVARRSAPPPKPLQRDEESSSTGGPTDRWEETLEEILTSPQHERPPRSEDLERLVTALRAEADLVDDSLPPAVRHLVNGGHPGTFWHRRAVDEMEGPEWWVQTLYPLWRWRHPGLRTPRRRRQRFLELVVSELERMEEKA